LLDVCIYITAYLLIFVKSRGCRFSKFRRLWPLADFGQCGGMRTPNQLSREAIGSFKAIYQEEFGEVLSDAEVQEIAMRLLRFFGVLMHKD
jgi:hypothetical protein